MTADRLRTAAALMRERAKIGGPLDFPSPLPDDALFNAIRDAEERALVDHRSGACRESEWSCSHCEREGQQINDAVDAAAEGAIA